MFNKSFTLLCRIVNYKQIKRLNKMKIKKILNQHRRDFMAIYECEHCGHKEKGSGYDDSNFHKNVIPNMECTNCGKKYDSNYRPLSTKYPDGIQV